MEMAKTIFLLLSSNCLIFLHSVLKNEIDKKVVDKFILNCLICSSDHEAWLTWPSGLA
jgi:hypothetical protein